MSVGIHTSKGFVKVAGVGMGASPMVGATENKDGTAGLVPAPAIEDKDKFLQGNGVWAEINLDEAVNVSKEYTDEQVEIINDVLNEKANADNVEASYASAMSLSGSTLTLKSKSGATLSTITLPASGSTVSSSEPSNPAKGEVWIA
jgi:hypothetical protein